MNVPALAYVGLGANLGEAARTVRDAASQLAALPGIEEFTLSPLYRTAPVDATGPDYVNAVARLRTALTPRQLLDALQALELRHGRERPYRNAPRTLDLDLLLYGELRMDTPRLVLPHPRMQARAFVLRPLLDLEPGLRLDGAPLAELLARCADQRLQRLD
jgi:2-amino-4-hydroxy-6-hydroxymethyldihydropteridine diphosphokinase